MANSNYWEYNSNKFGKTTKNRYDEKSKANSSFISNLSPEVKTKLEQLGITSGLFTTAGGNMSYADVQKGVDEIARLQQALGYSSNPTGESDDWGNQEVASGVIDQRLLDLLNSGKVKISTSNGQLVIEDGDTSDSRKITRYTSSLFKPTASSETEAGAEGGGDAKKGGDDATTITVSNTPHASSVKYTGPISYTDGYGSRHFGKAYLNRELYNNQGYGLKRQKHGNNVAARDLDLYALMRDSGTAGSGYNENHYLGALLRQAVGFSRDEDLSSVEKRDEVLARLYNTFGVRGRLGAYDRGRLRRDLEKYLRSKEAAEGKAWGYYYNNTNTDINMDGYIDKKVHKKARGGILKSPFDYSTPITRFQKGGAMKNQKNISPKEKEELTKAFLAWAESKDIPKEKLIQVMQIAENPNSDPKQRKAATEQIQTLYEQFIAEMQQSQQQTQAQVAALGAKLNYVNKLRRLQVGGALDTEEEGAFDENAELQTQFISWLMDAQGLSEEEAVSFLDELMSGQYSEEEVAPILNQFYEDLEAIQGYKKGGCVKKRQEGGSVSTREHLKRTIPFYGTYKDFQDGNYGSGVINGLGDLLLLGGGAAAAGAARAKAKINSAAKAANKALVKASDFGLAKTIARQDAKKAASAAKGDAALARKYNQTMLKRRGVPAESLADDEAVDVISTIQSRNRGQYPPFQTYQYTPIGSYLEHVTQASQNARRAEAAQAAADRAHEEYRYLVQKNPGIYINTENNLANGAATSVIGVPATKAAATMVRGLTTPVKTQE